MRRGWRSVARDELLSALHHSAAEGPPTSTAISSGRPQALSSLLRRADTGQSSGPAASIRSMAERERGPSNCNKQSYPRSSAAQLAG